MAVGERATYLCSNQLDLWDFVGVFAPVHALFEAEEPANLRFKVQVNVLVIKRELRLDLQGPLAIADRLSMSFHTRQVADQVAPSLCSSVRANDRANE